MIILISNFLLAKNTFKVKCRRTTTEEIAAGKHVGATEFSAYVDPVSSPFLDGHFIYTVIGGTVSTSPAMVITDFYAPADEFVVVQP